MTSLHLRIIEQTTAAQHAALRGEYGASARLLQEIAQAVRLEAMERRVMFKGGPLKTGGSHDGAN